MTKEQMMDNIIRRFGLESKVTIGFCKLVEGSVDRDTLEYWYMLLMNAYEDDDNEKEDYDYEDDFDECGYNPYMGCYDFDC